MFYMQLKNTYPKDTAIIYLALGLSSLDDPLNSFLALFFSDSMTWESFHKDNGILPGFSAAKSH